MPQKKANSRLSLTIIGILLLSFIIASPLSLSAQEDPDDVFSIPKTYSVQNRKYKLGDQIAAQIGYMPMDSFTKGVVLGGTYTKYFSDFTGWEMINASYIYNMDTGLKKQLIDDFHVSPGEIPDFPDWIITTNLAYTPIYNKNLFFNKNIIWGDITFVAGGGVGKFKRNGVKPLIDGGVMLRFFVSQTSSVKFDIRENLPFIAGEMKPFLTINMAYVYQFGSKKQVEANEVDDF